MTVRIRVIPCLDVRDGRVVKGVNFVDLRDAGDPVEQAQAYDAAGADELCFLDISASHEGRGTLLDMVRRTAEVCFMPLTVGGGVRSVEDARALLLAGADKVAVNSAAVTRPELVREIAEKFGSQCVVASVDARASTLATTHWLPNFSAISRTSSGRVTAAELTATLSAPASSSARASSTLRTPPPTVSGMKQTSAVRRTMSSSVPRPSWLAEMSRKQSSSAPAAS